MTTHARLTQLWSVLVDSARAQRVLNYARLGQLIGVPGQLIGSFMKPIHDYCNYHNLPPLTALVVCETDDPLSGKFTETTDLFGERARVYMFDWSRQRPPAPEDFQKVTDAETLKIPWHGVWQRLSR